MTPDNPLPCYNPDNTYYCRFFLKGIQKSYLLAADACKAKMVTNPARDHSCTSDLRAAMKAELEAAGGAYERWLELRGAAPSDAVEEITMSSPASLLPDLKRVFELTAGTASPVRPFYDHVCCP